MTISLKTATRIIELHAFIKTIKADLLALSDDREIAEASIYIKTKNKHSGWNDTSSRDFHSTGGSVAKIALHHFRKDRELKLAACLRELRQLGAEVPE